MMKYRIGLSNAILRCCSIVCAIYGVDAFATLARRPLSSLIGESDLICTGQLRNASLTNSGGVAAIGITSIYKGSSQDAEILLRWTNEPEDQRLNKAGSEWLLFLRKDKNGSYVATQYGRSYLLLSFDMDTEESVVLMLDRMGEIELDLPLKIGKTRTLCEVCRPGERWVEVPSVSLPELARVIKTRAGTGRQSIRELRF